MDEKQLAPVPAAVADVVEDVVEDAAVAPFGGVVPVKPLAADAQLQVMIPRPAWVSVGLWQIRTRATARFFALFSAAVATLGLYVGVTSSPIFLVAAAFYPAALWYWAAMRWVDARNAWGPEERPPPGNISALG